MPSLQYWKSVGNVRSEMVNKVEKLLWKVIFDATNDPDKLPSMLQNAMDQIQMEDLEGLEEYEYALFRRGKHIIITVVPHLTFNNDRPPCSKHTRC